MSDVVAREATGDEEHEVWVDYDYQRAPRVYEQCDKCHGDRTLQHHCDLVIELKQARAELAREPLTTIAQLDALPSRTVIEVRGELYRRRVHSPCWRNLDDNYDYLPENLLPAVVVWKP